MNYFELFGLPFQFELDISSLSARFQKLQRCCHPDNYVLASECDRLVAVQKAAQVNEAFQVLRDPVSRAEYMVSESGIDILGEQQMLCDSEFLVQQMAFREALEDIPNTNTPADSLLRVEQQAIVLYKLNLTKIADFLNEKKWKEAANIVCQMKFIKRLRDEIECLEEKLFN